MNSKSDIRNVDEITSTTMHHSFRPPLPNLKSVRLLEEIISSTFLTEILLTKYNY
ncbi:MAG: hypothetical protein KAI50_00775 [Desulfobacterales bacterium]|nr:hypothetical protein [Desulfobacterales bacterium]